MNRTLLALSLAGVCASCCGPERLTVPPLPVAGEPIAYPDLLTRLRVHAGAANEAFFVDDFDTLAARAQDIGQAASYLPRATNVPPAAKAAVTQGAARLTADARALAEAAQARNEDRVREGLRKVHTEIRQFPIEPAASPRDNR